MKYIRQITSLNFKPTGNSYTTGEIRHWSPIKALHSMLYTGLHGFSALVADHVTVPGDLHKRITVTSCLFYICSSGHHNSIIIVIVSRARG